MLFEALLLHINPFILLYPGKGQDYWEEGTIHEEMPACRQMFNIFHPFDPVAYRFVSSHFLGVNV